MSPPQHRVHCRCTRRTARQSAQPDAPTPHPETGPQVRGGGGCSGGVRVKVLRVEGTDNELTEARPVTCTTQLLSGRFRSR